MLHNSIISSFQCLSTFKLATKDTIYIYIERNPNEFTHQRSICNNLIFLKQRTCSISIFTLYPKQVYCSIRKLCSAIRLKVRGYTHLIQNRLKHVCYLLCLPVVAAIAEILYCKNICCTALTKV